MAESASATIAASQLDSTHWQYAITLTDPGTTTIGTFWFAWVPGQDFLDSQPTGITNPSGWTSVVTHGGSADGYAIRWVASDTSSEITSGGSLTGFSFTSTDPPAAVFGNSVFYSSTPVTTSFVYSAGPFSDQGFEFAGAETACFLPGTRILTDRGEIPVEELRIGDNLVTASRRIRRLCWIGRGGARAIRGRRSAATPVIVRKNALGDNVPNRDLHVTKGHSLFLDGVLIPVEYLVNHRSILWDDRAQEVTVFHLELDTHDVLLANSAPVESYRDDGNRWLFKNASASWNAPLEPPCAPVLTGGPIVDAVWQRLLDRAGARPGLPLTADADIHLLVDGQRLDATTRLDGVRIFKLGRPPAEVRLVSRAAVPQEIGQARDPRSLGIAVRRIALRQGTRFQVLQASDERLAEGFYNFEAGQGFRWTNGNAVFPSNLFASYDGASELVVHVAGGMQYIEDVPSSRAA